MVSKKLVEVNVSRISGFNGGVGGISMDRFTEEMKTWLFDLAHENLEDNDILRGFLKHYVLHGCTLGNVQDDIAFHTNYGYEGVEMAMKGLRKVLGEFVN